VCGFLSAEVFTTDSTRRGKRLMLLGGGTVIKETSIVVESERRRECILTKKSHAFALKRASLRGAHPHHRTRFSKRRRGGRNFRVTWGRKFRDRGNKKQGGEEKWVGFLPELVGKKASSDRRKRVQKGGRGRGDPFKKTIFLIQFHTAGD